MRTPGGNSGDGSGFDLFRFSDIPDREIQAYWRSSGGIHLAAAFVTIVAGIRGLAKSVFAAWLAARATSGYEDFNPSEPHNVVMFAMEDEIDSVVKPRIEAAGGDPLRVFGRNRLFLPSEKEALLTELVKREARLCILDTVPKCMDRGLRRTDNDHATEVLYALDEIARATNVAVVAITHLYTPGRHSSKAAEDAVVGAAAWVDHPRFVAVWGAGPGDDEENRVLAPLKWNPIPPPSALAFTVGDVTLPGRDNPTKVASLIGPCDAPADLVWRGQVSRGLGAEAKLDSCKEFVMHFLGGGKRRVSDLEAAAKAAGFSESTLNRARSELGIVAFQEDRAWWVRLPDPPDTIPEDWSF
jgi:hypothetical protein